MPYFFENKEKMSQNLSSAAVVIGALRVKNFYTIKYLEMKQVSDTVSNAWELNYLTKKKKSSK